MVGWGMGRVSRLEGRLLISQVRTSPRVQEGPNPIPCALDWPQPPQWPHAETLDTTTPSSASPSTLFHPLGKIGSQPEPFEYQTRIRRVERVLIFNEAKKRKIIKRSSRPPLLSITGSKRFWALSIERIDRSLCQYRFKWSVLIIVE